MLSRQQGWDRRLYEAIESAKIIPFTYGVHDCCLWAAHCVDEMCGTRLLADVQARFNYTDKDGADAVIAAAGGLKGLVSEFLGEPVRAAFAAPGDVVLARNGDGEAIIGIAVGHGIVVPGPGGLTALPYEAGVLCWKV